jgi:hypothetical protein
MAASGSRAQTHSSETDATTPSPPKTTTILQQTPQPCHFIHTSSMWGDTTGIPAGTAENGHSQKQTSQSHPVGTQAAAPPSQAPTSCCHSLHLHPAQPSPHHHTQTGGPYHCCWCAWGAPQGQRHQLALVTTHWNLLLPPLLLDHPRNHLQPSPHRCCCCPEGLAAQVRWVVGVTSPAPGRVQAPWGVDWCNWCNRLTGEQAWHQPLHRTAGAGMAPACLGPLGRRRSSLEGGRWSGWVVRQGCRCTPTAAKAAGAATIDRRSELGRDLHCACTRGWLHDSSR